MSHRFGLFRKAVDLVGRPPGVPFIAVMAALGLVIFVSSWTPGLTVDEYGFYPFSALVLAVVLIIARTPFTLVRLCRTRGSVARVVAPPLLLVLAIVSAFYAERLRIALSQDALDAYARTVTAVECDEATFHPRRVGLYTVTCADRPIPSEVSLAIHDRLTPDGSGIWFLVGPGHWELAVQD